LESNELQPDLIKNTNGECIWSTDNNYLFYVKKDKETLRDYSVCRHKIGTAESEDVEIFVETDDTFYLSISKSRSNKFLIIHSSQTISNEDLYLSLDKPLEEVKIFNERIVNVEYQIDHFKETFYILTNYHAENFCLMSCEEGDTNLKNWKIEIATNPDILLEQFLHFNECLVVAQRYNGLTQLKIIPTNEEQTHLLAFPENAYMASIGMNPSYHLPYIRVQYQSMSTPSTVYDYDWKEKKLNFRKQQTVVGDFKSENYQSERIFIPGKDGTLVPISLQKVSEYEMEVIDGRLPQEHYDQLANYGESIRIVNEEGSWANLYRDAVDECGNKVGNHELKALKLITKRKGKDDA
jgi:oligopeptidase B